MKYLITLAAVLFCTSASANPRVITDIAPIHSLVSQVMDGVGIPENLLDAKTSPHGFSLRPSQAKALADADLVFWVGPELTPWLDRALEGLAGKARTLALIDAPQSYRLEIRKGATFDAHEHHDEHSDHDEHSEHGHEAIDPHAWLDPENAKVWLALIADALSDADPENAEIYKKNAKRAVADVDRMTRDISSRLSDINAPRFVVFHDAYHYFEARFEIEAMGAIALNDATKPGPKRLREIQNILKEQDIRCVFSEPQFNPRLIKAISSGLDIRIVTLDPMGTTLATGPALYGGVMRGIAEAMVACLE